MKGNGFRNMVVASLVLAGMLLGGPAFADSKISGYYRMQMITDNLAGAPAKNKAAESVVDNRLRIKYKNNLNDYVNFVYYMEVDTPWGMKSKGGIGGGGMAGADGVNVETKNVYLDFKIPDTIWSVRTGIQGFADHFNHAFFADDWAGIRIDHQVSDSLQLTTAYFKAAENDITQWDDVDLYVVQAGIKLSDTAKLDLEGWYNDDNSNASLKKDDLYLLGAAAKAKVSGIGLDGWVGYLFGKKEPISGTSVDTKAMAGTVKATTTLGAAKTGLRVMYFSSDDDAKNNKAWSGVQHKDPAGKTEFDKENLMIFLADGKYNNFQAGRHALTDAAYKGYGLVGVNATADFKLPASLYLNTGAGYFLALKDKINGEPNKSVDGKDLGLEVAARLGTKIADKVDVSLAGAYAFLGSFYKAPGSTVDPDNMYKVNFMINVGF